LFDANHIVMDEEVLCICELKEQDKMDEKETTVLNAIQRYRFLKEAYLMVVTSSNKQKNFKITHSKAVINLKKENDDEPAPPVS